MAHLCRAHPTIEEILKKNMRLLSSSLVTRGVFGLDFIDSHLDFDGMIIAVSAAND